MNYIITSGWWCGDNGDITRPYHGSDKIRELNFFTQWKHSITSNSSPKAIFIVDSASDKKPSPEQLSGMEFVSLMDNAGHSTRHKGKFSGYMRSIIMGIEYARLCDVDYWVYVEQDALLSGQGIIEHCIKSMKTPYMFGSGDGTPQFLQQSLIIIHRDGFDKFLQQLSRIKARDCEISPETKFLIASSSPYRLLPETLLRQISKNNRLGRFIKKWITKSLPYLRGYDLLPIGYGRTRPINFTAPYYYFQHGSDEELDKYYSSRD
jgi:hypothetical protein